METVGSKEKNPERGSRDKPVENEYESTENDITENASINVGNMMNANTPLDFKNVADRKKMAKTGHTILPKTHPNSKISFHGIDAIFEEPSNSCIRLSPDSRPDHVSRTYEASKTFTSAGGQIKWGDWTIDVHENALLEQITLKFIVQHRIQQRNEVNDWMILDPIILFSTSSEASISHLAPGGQITIRAPTCYYPNCSIAVKVERTSWSRLVWKEYQRFRFLGDGWIKFAIHGPSNLDRSYRFWIRMRDCIKSVAHMMFASERSKNSYELIWCFCDNLKEAKLELQKNLKAREYFKINQAKEFLMSKNDSFVAYLEIPEGSVDKPTQTIESDLLWSSDSFEELSFTVENLREGGNIKYKIEKMKTNKKKASSGGEEKMFQFHNNAEETESYFI